VIKFSTTITCQYDTDFSPFTAVQYEEALDWASESGFDGVELCIANYQNLDLLKIKDDLDRRQLSCSTISTSQARTFENISLTHPDPAAQQKARQRLFEHIDAAKLLGSKVTIGMLRGRGDLSHITEQKKLLLRNMAACVEYAQSRQVTLLLEPINRYETMLYNNTEQIMEFIAELGNPDCLGVLWDVFHANIEDPDFEKAINRMGDRLRHVHLADSNRYFPGWGHIDFGAIYDKLRKVGYNEYLSLECLNLPSVQTVREQSANFIARLRKR